MRRNSEKGFSLIELSIVLIIIGLLIAGITGGASLVKSATVRAVISEANSFNSAVNAYYAKKSNLPGDDAQDGNKNGRIEYINSGGHYESNSAWKNLASEGIVEGSFVSYQSGGNAVPGESIPVSKLSAAGWAFDFRDDMNMLVLSNPSSGIGFVSGTSAGIIGSSNVISPENAASIDQKMDDNKGNTGKIRGYNDTDLTNCYDDENAATLGDYVTATKTPACFMGFATAL